MALAILCHKITEPYAQIPTISFKKNGQSWPTQKSQNNRALRSNPNKIQLQNSEETPMIQMSQNNRALRSNPNK